MYATLTIVFREGLEIAIIISLLMAATKGIANRTIWILMGSAFGVFCASLLGYFALNNEMMLSLIKAKVTGGIILTLSALLIAYTVIWMKENGRKASSGIKESVAALSSQKTPLLSLSAVAFFCVLREGVEVVMFLLALTTTAETTNWSILSGALIGAGGSIFVGCLMYFGLLKLNLSKVFNFFAILMSFLSAGMLVNAIGKFTSAGILNPVISQVWDSSAFLDHHTSWLGLLMHVMFGYTEHPSLIQVIAYMATLILLFIFSKRATARIDNQKA